MTLIKLNSMSQGHLWPHSTTSWQDHTVSLSWLMSLDKETKLQKWASLCSILLNFLGGQKYNCLLTAAALSARTYVITWDCTEYSLHTGLCMCGEAGWLEVVIFSPGGPLEPQWPHHTRLFSTNVALFSLLNQSDCHEKEGGQDAVGERVKLRLFNMCLP